jgi:hypothetical protein
MKLEFLALIQDLLNHFDEGRVELANLTTDIFSQGRRLDVVACGQGDDAGSNLASAAGAPG